MTEDPTAPEGLRLGYLDPFRPFCWSENGSARGSFVIALTARLPPATRLAWRPAPLAALPRHLATGRIDAIAAKAVTATRAGQFTFSEPLLHTAAALFARAGTTPPALSDTGTATIATPGNGPLVAIIRAEAPCARLLLTPDYDAALAALLAGRTDFAALNADAGADLAQRVHPGRISRPGPRFAPLGLAVATLPGDPHGILPRIGLFPLHLA